MLRYIQRRILLSIPALILVSIIVFSLTRLAPGDVLMAQIGDSGFVTEEQLDEMREQMGLNEPVYTQFVWWWSDILRGDLGESLWTGNAISSELGRRMPVTIQLMLMATVIALFFGVILGLVAAMRQNRIEDHASRFIAVFGLSFPDFWLATMLILFLTLQVGWMPDLTYVPIWEDPQTNLLQFVFPALVIGYRLSATTARMLRSTMLEVLREDYIRTARAKGLMTSAVIRRHALKNSLIPVITIIGTQTGFLLGGVVIMEIIWGLPGMGSYIYQSVLNRDYTVVQASVLILAVLIIAINLLVDISYAWFDPRIRYG